MEQEGRAEGWRTWVPQALVGVLQALVELLSLGGSAGRCTVGLCSCMSP